MRQLLFSLWNDGRLPVLAMRWVESRPWFEDMLAHAMLGDVKGK